MSDAQESVQSNAEEQALSIGDFSQLLQKEFRPQSDRAREAVETAVQTLAQRVLVDTSLVSADAVRTIEGIVASIDKKLTAQANLILHHPDFQQLEGAWRGLH